MLFSRCAWEVNFCCEEFVFRETKGKPALRLHTFFTKNLLLLELTETTDGTSDGSSGGGGDDVGTASKSLAAALALPDAGGGSLDGGLAAERAGVLGVLGDFSLLDLLSEGSTITGAVLTNDTDLLCSLGHFVLCVWGLASLLC